ncbi:hypothetical protein TWF103_003440 [Orbilia oligospora]|nr:hypothetical protein TWF103_003440 [Orbilia oligospora]
MLATCLPFPYVRRDRKTNIVNKVVAGIVIIGYFPIIILLLAAWCHPLEAYWTTSLMSDGHRACFTFIPHNIAVLVVNTVADLLVLAVPIPMIWKVKVSHLRKFIIIAIFGIGIFNIKLCGLDGKGSELCGNCGNLYYYVPLIKMVEKWVSGLRMKRASYRQAESPGIEQTPHPDMEEGGKSIEPCDAELTKGNEFMITKALGDNV